MKPSVHPPTWPLTLMRFFIKDKYLEEIEGDMEEIFFENVERFSVRKARRLYAWEMIRLLRPILLRNMEFVTRSRFGILENYLKVSSRGLVKHPLTAFINLFGLAAAVGFCVFAYGFARWTYNRDQFHLNKDHVFLATFFASREGVLQEYGQSPRPLAELLKQDFAQVKKVARVEGRNVVVKHQEAVFNERIRLVDPEFLDMFTFPLKWGVASSIKDVNSIILSESMSQKYFGDENPLGASLTVKFDKARSKEFKITGVAQKFPAARSMDFDFLINFDNIRTSEANYDLHDWSAFLQATFVQVADPADIIMIQQGMDPYKQQQNKAASEDFAIESFGFEPLATLHLRTDEIRDDIFRAGSKDNVTSIKFLVVVCVLMLLLASFNYINIAIVSATKRLKELGVRKSIGASRKAVVIQFLAENLVVTSFALILGLLFGRLAVIPWFESLWHFDMGFKFDDARLWIFLFALMVTTTVISGIYPSVYVSRFLPVNILRGSIKFGQKNPATKVFLGLQLILASVFITSAVLFTQNTDYLAHRSWGYSNRDVLYTLLPDELSWEQLKTAMERNPLVQSLSGSVHHVGRQEQPVVIHFPSSQFEADLLAVDANYFETMGIQVISGRGFDDHEGSDQQAVVVNETMANNLKWDHPLGQQFKIDSTEYTVVGLVKDFHSSNFFRRLKPIVFKVGKQNDFRYLSMKVRQGSEHEFFENLKKNWAHLFPETPFNGGFQEDSWGNYYAEIEIHGHVWRVFASVAVILATLGLYGLVTLNVSGRAREFSIRKVLGADLRHISNTIFKQYYGLFGVALIIGAPLSYLFIKAVLDFAYTYHIPVTPWAVVLASGILVLVLISTVSTQVFKVFKNNPVDGLKIE